MVGEARFTAHGSVGAVAAPDAGLGVAGAVIEAVSLAVVACGILATVESPEPQAVKVPATTTTAARPVSGLVRHDSDNTLRTVPRSGAQVRQAWPGSGDSRDHHGTPLFANDETNT